MPIYKRCIRCHKRIPSGTKCECLKQRHKVYDLCYRDTKSADFYHSKEWELTRETVLTLDKGVDVYLYMTTGEVTLADTVHHIDPLKDNWDRRCDIDNLISLSNETHSMIEQLYKKDKDGTMKMLYEMLRRYRDAITDKETTDRD